MHHIKQRNRTVRTQFALANSTQIMLLDLETNHTASVYTNVRMMTAECR